MKKSLFVSTSLLASLLLLSSCSAEKTETDTLHDAVSEAEIETTAESEETYEYISPTFTAENGTYTAADADHSPAMLLMQNSLAEENFAAEVTVNLASNNSDAGMLIRCSVSEEYDGVVGYAFTVSFGKVHLYELTGTHLSGMTIKELASDVITPTTDREIRLRAERNKNTVRFYYLDDADEVEPWPEIVYNCNLYRGSGIGFFDSGYGASFSNLTVTEFTPDEPADAETYTNPVISSLQAADPYVLCHDGTYYCYSTSAPLGYYVYTSDDMVNWTNAGLCIEEAWGIDKSGYYWAPEVIEHGGKFYMLMTVDERIGFATADSPLGPFVPEETWLFTQTIDGHVFIDDDGQAYMYYVSWKNGTYGIYGCELEDDIVTVRPDTEKLLLKPEVPWETDMGHITEGPFMLKHEGVYFLTYSGSNYESQNYAVGYAVSSSPLGTFSRADGNPVLSMTSRMNGPGHHSFTRSASGELFIVYHVHASDSAVHPRKTCIDRARFAPTKEGGWRLEVLGPTYTKQIVP